VLRRLLLNKGIAVKGDVKLGGSDEREELVLHRSRPLSALLHELGKKSDNFYAEMLLKTIGLKRKGAPARSAAGAEATVAWLKKVGAWDPGSRVENGSGLYDANRLSPRTITRFLAQMLRDPKLSVDFLDQLAVGGIDGTLAGRFYSLKSQRSVLAKTGTLRRIASLSGYVFGPDRQKAVSFSFIVADAPGRHAQSRQRIDAIVTTMAKELWKSA
jgi:D-alanyl-D-alanine carboxypeptidase/D-alanyl-D-alanine-endopeptidase (penicillin-binding protein 4)